MEKTIWFDMDGTLADLYSIENWLDKLNARDVKPYEQAKPLLNMRALARLLNTLQRKGYAIGVISWTADNASVNYHKAIQKAKQKWLKKHLASVRFDFIDITPYGEPKQDCRNGILFDDNADIRKGWNGIAYDETAILEVLKAL